MTSDPRVDAYIEKSAEFAQPMLRKLREQAHAICPEAEEAIKWGMPAIVYRGKNLCGLAAFKAHVGLFVEGERKEDGAEGMGEFGKMRSVADLPTKAALTKVLRERMKAIEAGPTRRVLKPPPEVPPDLAKALKASKPAATTFKALSATNQRDYVNWITEAKQVETRARRIAQSIEWLSEGKPRNWKYMKK
ncbi:YdeI/OmpD-associated family protein [Hyphomonas sp.]|uniref:YdeI/OmpD-associated family protein n=1 Tax=Hyphomonas sp. TaxID=87 RepID=UPI00391A5A96